MKTQKFLYIVGNRPQFIKLAPFLRAIRPHKQIENVIVHSGQHYDFKMSQIFFEELGLPEPDYNLGVGSGTHGVQTGRILARLDSVLLKENPDFVFVFGDTNTTIAGALAAQKLHFRLGHVESGLRENIWRPEEINRKISDHCSDFLFCPTRTAVANLIKEDLPQERIFLTGDITYDAFLWSVKKINAEKKGPPSDNGFVLLTLHRAESVDYEDILREIISTLMELDEPIIFPVHPRTMGKLKKFHLLKEVQKSAKIRMLPAVGYFEFLKMLLAARIIITDSGGVIKEAFYAKKPCVTLDDTTEYEEIQESGINIWAGKNKKPILNAVRRAWDMDASHVRPEAVFGDGNAAEKMISIVLSAQSMIAPADILLKKAKKH